MTWVRNLYHHPYQPTTGPAFGSREEADISISAPAEQEAIAVHGLLVLDPGYTPPPPETPPLAGDWRSPVETVADLPSSGNQRGDVRLVASEGTAYRWDSGWIAMAGGGSGSLVVTAPGDATPTVITDALWLKRLS
jgi:hypothetical protein